MTTLDEEGFISEEINEKQEGILKEFSELFTLSRQINQIAQQIQYLLLPHSQDPQELLATVLYRRILDFYQGSFHLASMGLDGPFKILLRSQIEAYALLKANELNFNFFKEMNKDHEYRRLQYFKSASRFESGIFSKIRNLENFNQILGELEAKKPKQLYIHSVFERAGLKEEYYSIYALLSTPAHHGLLSLEDYFIMSGGAIKSIRWGPETKDIGMFFDIGSKILFEAMRSIYTLFEIKDKKYIDKAEQIGKKIVEKINQISIEL